MTCVGGAKYPAFNTPPHTHTLHPWLQAYVGVNWVMSDVEMDVETELALGFLDYLMLVGHRAGAVLKACCGVRWCWPNRSEE